VKGKIHLPSKHLKWRCFIGTLDIKAVAVAIQTLDTGGSHCSPPMTHRADLLSLKTNSKNLSLVFFEKKKISRLFVIDGIIIDYCDFSIHPLNKSFGL